MSRDDQYKDRVIEGMQMLYGKGFLSPGGAPEVDLMLDGVDLAALYREAGQPQLARGALAQGMTLGGDEAVLHQELGRLLWEEGDGARALELRWGLSHTVFIL